MLRMLSSVRVRVIGAILLALVPAVVLFHVVNREDRAHEIAALKAESLTLVRTIAGQEEDLLDGTRQLLMALSLADEITSLNIEGSRQLLTAALAQYGRYLNFGVADLNGLVLCSAVPASPGVSVADRKYFREALATDGFAVGEFQVGRVTDAPSINCGYPIHGTDGPAVGVLFAAIGLGTLGQIETGVTSSLPPGSILTKVDDEGVVLVRVPSDESLVGSRLQDPPLLAAVLARGDGVTTTVDQEGRHWVSAFAVLPSRVYAVDLHVILAMPEARLFAAANHVFDRNVIIMGVVGAILLAGTWLGFEYGLVRQVRSLHRATRSLTSGDLTARCPTSRTGPSELNKLAVAFNRMAESLEQREREIRKAEQQASRSLDDLVRAVSDLVDARDAYTAGHQRRVAALAVAIAQQLGTLSPDQIAGLRIAALLHDIGKTSVPTEILVKPSKLTDTELQLVRAHPRSAYDILKSVAFPWPIADMVLQHHERLDGSGYPRGLSARDGILIEARIMAVADVVEAMSSHRPYRPALGIDAALREIDNHRGDLYDPLVVDACIAVFRRGGFRFGE